MKKFLKVILVLVIGFVGGVITTCYLSMRASSSLIDFIKIEYETEQELMAIRAKKQGNLNQAVIHYSNLAAASSSPGLHCFSRGNDIWSMDFPFGSIILRRMIDAIPEKGKNRDEAMRRAVLADALERSGRIEEANAEYSKAVNLFGCGWDISKIKEIAKAHMLYENTKLELLQDKFLYPQK